MWTLHFQLVEREAKREEAGGSGGGKTRPPSPPTSPLGDGREVWPGRTGSRGEAGRVTSGSHPGLLSPWVAVWEAALLQQSADWPCGRWDPEGSEPGQVPASAQVKQGEQPQGAKGSPWGPRSCSEHGDTPPSSCPWPFDKIAEHLGSCLSCEPRSCLDADGHSSWGWWQWAQQHRRLLLPARTHSPQQPRPARLPFSLSSPDARRAVGCEPGSS